MQDPALFIAEAVNSPRYDYARPILFFFLKILFLYNNYFITISFVDMTTAGSLTVAEIESG